jgi:hypothetical protein
LSSDYRIEVPLQRHLSKPCANVASGQEFSSDG